MEKSWYMLLFQFEGVAERWLSDDRGPTFGRGRDHPDVDAVIADLEANGSLTPALNWYRANIPRRPWSIRPSSSRPSRPPTMAVWSSGDFALTEEQMTGSAAYVVRAVALRADWRAPGHWMQLEAPDEVNRLLLDFLPEPEPVRAADGST